MNALVDATWPEVDAASRDVLIVPLGATEQHGPHLPLDTDTRLASEVAARLHDQRPGSGLAPALPIGASGEHADFPGTLSIGTDALRMLVIELVRDASRHWGAVLVVNGHGGNVDALRSAAALCRDEGRRLGVVHLALAGMDGHAGCAETSMMLHLDPQRVRLDLVAPGTTAPVAELLPQLRAHGMRSVTTDGVLGDPTAATAAIGETWLAALAEHAAAAYDALAAS